MLFATFDYFLFLPVVAVVHWLIGSPFGRTSWLFLVSLVFYAAWDPGDTVALLAIVGISYIFGLVQRRAPESARGLLLAAAAVCLLGPMVYFKYTRWVMDTLSVFVDVTVPERHHLPIGISFYSFQALAYVIDVRRTLGARSRGEVPKHPLEVESNPIRFATFLLFFPHLVAGPILRAGTLLTQLRLPRRLDPEDVSYALTRLATGLVKKLLIADVLRVGVVDSMFADPVRFGAFETLVALYAYSLQIYCDFSGYTDFAIGSARLFGFRIPENFDRPYRALSVAEYWRRWHITLSDWVRDYVYYPLGGSREGRLGPIQPYLNTYITLVILAVWHGANWTFVLYGLLHGTAVSINRYVKRAGWSVEAPSFVQASWRWALTFHFVVLARILFRSPDLDVAGSVVEQLVHGNWAWPRYSLHAWVVLALGYALHASPPDWATRARAAFGRLPAPVQGALLVVAGWLCVQYGPGDSLAFIYHDF
ncbi:MAG: MBOAT family protein [Myxococcales bacterium]|nr:MBOAT family protein [Myxococcales bacterium]